MQHLYPRFDSCTTNRFNYLIQSMDWIGLMIGLDWIGLDWIGLDWIGLDWIGLDWIGLDWIGLDWIGLDWIGLGWIGEYREAHEQHRHHLLRCLLLLTHTKH